MNAALETQDGGEICQEIEKIATWMSNEWRRNNTRRSRSVADAKKFPTPNLRWHLGVRSVSDPADIMLKVYAVLKKINFEWHTVNPYQLVIRQKFVENKVKKRF